MKEAAVRIPRMRRKKDGFATFYAKRLLRTSRRLVNDLKQKLQWNNKNIYRVSEPPHEKSRTLEIMAFSAKRHRVPMRAAWPARY